MAKSDRATASEAKAGTSTTKWISPSVLQAAVSTFGIHIQTGTYVGTGTWGKNNPTSLTFDFVPKLVNIVDELSYGYHPSAPWSNNSILWMSGITRVMSGTTNSSEFIDRMQHDIRLDGKTLIWNLTIYSSSTKDYAHHQLNASGTTYYYFAIG